MRLQIALLLALRYGLLFLAVSGFVVGTIILVVRVIFLVPGRGLLWGLLSFLPAVIWTVVQAIRKMPSRKALRALFDDKSRCGGLLMAADELNLGSWREKMPKLGNVHLKWHGGRSFSLFAIALIFVAVSFLIPQRYVNIATARPLNITEDVEKLQEQIDTLEEEKIISEEAANEFEQKLEQIRDKTSGSDPVKTWEALDYLQQSVKKEAEQFASSSLSRTENLAQAQTLAQGLADGATELDPNILSEAMAELSTMVNSCAAKNESLKNKLGEGCLNACKQGSLSAEQLEALLKALKENKESISNCMGKLCNAGLVDMNAMKLCEKMGTCNSQGLAAFLKENAKCMGTCNAVSQFCQNPGRGGVNRGRGDAPMTWTDGSDESGAVFKEQILPPASLSALKDSMMVGVSVGAPSVEDNPASSGTGALNSAAAGSGEAFSQTILPRHKGAVKRYFERP